MSRALLLVRHLTKRAEAAPKRVPKAKPPQNYILFDQFPRAPEAITNASFQELCDMIGTKLPKPKPSDNFVDFTIPDKYIKSKAANEITDKDRRLLQELDNFVKSTDEDQIAQAQYNLIKLYYDKETDSYKPLPDHSLKKLLLGLLKLNPSLDDIDDEYLWRIIPREKMFGVRPFELLGLFKEWEQKMLAKSKEEDAALQQGVREARELVATLNKSSFFRKQGSRKKVDRKLVRKYKQLKREGKITDFEDDDDL